MGVHHLISVSEDQLRGWQGDPDELLSNIGSAVVLACLGSDNNDVSISSDVPNASIDTARLVITVKHIEKHQAEDFAVWVWTAGDDVCIADLTD